jgi:pimeloyl-ACP methyl ester carboxylesterase
MVLVHGDGADLQSWDGVIKNLASDYECLTYDLRGHGNSAKGAGPYSLDMFVENLRSITEEVGWHRFDLVGFSLGGLIAQGFSLAHPEKVRTLTIVSSVSGRTPEESARVMARANTLATSGVTEHLANSVERWFTDEFSQANPEVVQGRIARSLTNDPTCYAAAYRVLAESDLVDQLHQIPVPTLVMTGEKDGGSTPRMAQLMATRIPNARCVIFPRLKHSVLLESPALVATEIVAFLKNNEINEPDRSDLVYRGVAARRAVLGDVYVNRSSHPPSDFAYAFSA